MIPFRFSVGVGSFFYAFECIWAPLSPSEAHLSLNWLKQNSVNIVQSKNHQWNYNAAAAAAAARLNYDILCLLLNYWGILEFLDMNVYAKWMLHPGKFSPAWGHGVYNTYIVQSKNHQWNYNAAAAAAARLNYDILCLLLNYWGILEFLDMNVYAKWMLHPGKFSPAWGHGVYNTYIVQSKNHQWNYNAAAAAARLNYDILCLLLNYWGILEFLDMNVYA